MERPNPRTFVNEMQETLRTNIYRGLVYVYLDARCIYMKLHIRSCMYVGIYAKLVLEELVFLLSQTL